MDRLTGTGVALITPFDEYLRIDRESLCRLVEYVILGGVDFLVVLGTTGECATLTAEEKAEVIKIVAEVNRGRLPLIAGIGGNNTTEVIREIRQTAWLKLCDGILSITPFYNKPTQMGLYEHFKAISEVSPLPLCLYNVPGRTGVNMKAETVARLSYDCPNIIAVKEASGDFAQATDILKMKRPDFSALSGDDAILLPLMSLGFCGVISVAANILPREFSALVNSVKKGDYATAQNLHIQLSEIGRALFEEGNPAGVKAALHAAGLIRHNTLRLPLTPVNEILYARIKELIRPFQV
ncbi:MAG: 4-hydroxy-tetrahydrodipicolinate synthase [Odoribacter sp.]